MKFAYIAALTTALFVSDSQARLSDKLRKHFEHITDDIQDEI